MSRISLRIVLGIVLFGTFLGLAATSRADPSFPERWSRYENESLQLASDVAVSQPCITAIWQAPAAPGDLYLAYFPYSPQQSNLVYLEPGRRYYVYCRPAAWAAGEVR